MVRDVSEREPNKTRFDVATVAYQGARDYQEDSIISHFPAGQPTGYAVLADGMGGHEAGNVASALVLSEVFSQLKMKELATAAEGADIPTMLRGMTRDANARITAHVTQHEETYGMGSTLLATLIQHDQLYWISVGDSPLFMFRDGALRQLNKDHSMAPQIDMMVKVGAMTPEVGRDHPDRNTLTSAITGKDIALIDCPEEPTKLMTGDILISSSDGLQFLTNEEITQVLKDTKNQPSAAIANALLDAVKALENPDQDNTAFAVVKLDHVAAKTVVATDSDLAAPAPALEEDDEPVENIFEEITEEVAPAAAAAPEEPEIEVVSEPDDVVHEDTEDEEAMPAAARAPAAAETNVPEHKVVAVSLSDGPAKRKQKESVIVVDANAVAVPPAETVNVAPIERNGRRTLKVVKPAEPRQRFVPKRPSDPDYDEDAKDLPEWYRQRVVFKD